MPRSRGEGHGPAHPGAMRRAARSGAAAGLALILALHALLPCSGGAAEARHPRPDGCIKGPVGPAGRGHATVRVVLPRLSGGVGCVRSELAGVTGSGAGGGAACWRPATHPVRALRGGDGEDGAVALSDAERRENEKIERDKALIAQLQGMRNECNKLKKRINTLREEIEEHESAANVLGKFDSARPCKRAVGGVLMESSVGEILPAVQNEQKLLAKAMEEMTAKLHENEKQMNEFQKKHDIRIVSEEQENSV